MQEWERNLKRFYGQLTLSRYCRWRFCAVIFDIAKKSGNELPRQFEIGKAESQAEVIAYDLFKEHGIDFEFQQTIGPYRVDFLSAKKVVIEIDGPLHARPENWPYDERRNNYLRKRGYKVLRIPIQYFADRTDDVLEAVKRHIHETGRMRHSQGLLFETEDS